MAENTPTAPTHPFIPVEGLIDAPIVYFEVCPTIGNNNGIINVMLAASIIEPIENNGVNTRIRAVAHLRMNILGAVNLRDSLNNALLIGAPVENPTGKAN